MAGLCGKGIWTAYSHDLQRAAEMANEVGANYILVKVGHGPHYFPETTHHLVERVRTLGLHPLAWVHLTPHAPQDALKAIVESLSVGYEATALMLDTQPIAIEALRALVEALDNVEIPRERLYLCSPPPSQIADTLMIEVLAPLCQGGWMPQTFATWDTPPERVIDRDIYQALGDLSLQWNKTPDVYPVLSPLPSADNATLLPEEFIPWVEGIARHGVDFFSVYHAAITEKVLWPMLESLNVACMETAEYATVTETTVDHNTVVPQPVYITVAASDTVWGIITRYGLNKQQFWAWNAHLWESRSLPRDPDYLQEGWRIRVK